MLRRNVAFVHGSSFFSFPETD